MDAKKLEQNPNMGVPWFLLASYAYYELDESLMLDTEFDSMCLFMLQNWDQITHMHKHLITKPMLECGSGFDIRKYPSMVKSSCMKLVKDL